MKIWFYEYLGADGIIPLDAPASNIYLNPKHFILYLHSNTMDNYTVNTPVGFDLACVTFAYLFSIMQLANSTYPIAAQLK